jgi:hypothetical protein
MHGLVRIQELVDPMDVLSPFTANQAAAFATWAAAGFEDTLLRWKAKPEVVYGIETIATLQSMLQHHADRPFPDLRGEFH